MLLSALRQALGVSSNPQNVKTFNHLLNTMTMSVMKFLPLPILLFLIWATVTSASSLTGFDCTSVHAGRFFQYKNQSQLYSTIIRHDSMQIEINALTGDTSKWKIRWTDDCTFICQYMSGAKFKSDQELNFYKQSILVFKIKTLEHDYYTYDAELKYNSISKTFSDTLWRQTK